MANIQPCREVQLDDGVAQGKGIVLTTTLSLTVVSYKITNNLVPVSSPTAVVNNQLASRVLRWCRSGGTAAFLLLLGSHEA